MRIVAAENTSITVWIAACGVPPLASTCWPVAALNRTSTAPVGESMPVASGGSDVVSAIHAPAMQLPTSIAQMASGVPADSSPGNISAAERDDVGHQHDGRHGPGRRIAAERAAAIDPAAKCLRRATLNCAAWSLEADLWRAAEGI